MSLKERFKKNINFEALKWSLLWTFGVVFCTLFSLLMEYLQIISKHSTLVNVAIPLSFLVFLISYISFDEGMKL